MRYITPEKILQMRFEDAPRPHWDAAILCFRDLTASRAVVAELGAAPTGQRALWGKYEFPGDPHVFEVRIGEHLVAIVGQCLWGGPQASIFVEELACLGARFLIGIGCAGALAADLPMGCPIIAQAGLTTDGTSRAYTDEPEVRARPELMAAAQEAAHALGVEPCPVRAATVDALYRETDAAVRAWAALGAQVVNMETTPFYAASAACGVRSLWIGHVSDRAIQETWEEWGGYEDAVPVTARIAFETLKRVL